MSLWVTGDTHGHIDLKKIKLWSEYYNPTSKDFLLICGDFGSIFNENQTRKEKEILELFGRQKFTTLFIDGNHDNHRKIREYPREIVERENIIGIFNIINNKLLYIDRGHIFTINGDMCIGIGGASSIDKKYRKENIDWWSTELINKDEEEYIIEQINKIKKVKYVFTHASPLKKLEMVYDEFDLNRRFYDPTTVFLDYVEENLKYEKWFCGHYHIDKTIGNFRFLYDDVVKISE